MLVALQYATVELRDDKEVLLEALTRGGRPFSFVLRLAPETLRGNKAVVLAAVRRCGRSLHSTVRVGGASWGRGNGAEAVRQEGVALLRASMELRGDKEVALVAVKQNVHALRYASVRRS